MSVLFQTGRYLFRKTYNYNLCKCVLLRNKSDVPRKFITFDEIMAQRRAEARRSLVVQVNSESSFKELYGYCSKYGSIKDIYHYTNSEGEHFMLVEFCSEDNLTNVLQFCGSHQKDPEIMPVQSPFVWFKAASGSKQNFTTGGKELQIKDGNHKVDEDILYEELMNCESVSQQIQMLYDRTVLNDVGVRLRFIVARQLEVIFNSLYTDIQVYPFGSSVNGFGRMGCDVDLVLTNNLTDETRGGGRLVRHEKRSAGGRGPWQRHLELAAALLELRVPGAARVTRVLHARVPIVKYSHLLADVDCDLCFNHTSGVHMSAALQSLGALCPAARSLCIAVRRWAAAVQLTQSQPGRSLTNFPLTLMVLFFLMRERILPSFRRLVDCAGAEDIRITEDNLNCTFLRDLSRLPSDAHRPTTDNLQTLLLKFFEFYSQFDFQEHAISVIEGKPIRKPNSLPLYVVNPLEPALNVSRNVSFEECERLKLEVRNAAWHLEAGLDNNKSEDWGILGLIEGRTTRGLKKLLRAGNSHRLVSVKDLFNDGENGPSATGFENYSKTDKKVESSVRDTKFTLNERKNGKIKFKNTQTANEVYRIRRNKLI